MDDAVVFSPTWAAPGLKFDWQRKVLIKNAAATSAAVRWPGGKGLFDLVGTVGGATITLQYRAADEVTYNTVPNCALTAVGAVNFDLPPGMIRVLVAGGAPSALYASVQKIRVQ